MRWRILISLTRTQEIQVTGIDDLRVLIDEGMPCIRTGSRFLRCVP